MLYLHREEEQRNRPRRRESFSPTSYSTTPTVAPPLGAASAARHSPWWAPNHPHPQISMVTHQQTLSLCVMFVLVVNPIAFCLFRNTDKTKLVGTFHIEFFLLAYLNDLNRGGRGGYVFQDLILIEILFLFAKCSAQNYLFQLFKGWC